jgi:ribosomal peptide maturation radical SAM protein 1
MGYFKNVLPHLANDGGRRKLFYEVKSNLNRSQVELLRRAGVTWIQPGIESLHSEVLRLMDKGVKGWQNIQLLKWAREFGLRMSWAILWGFPGEQDDWYKQMAAWMPPLEHLQAPSGLIRLRYDRYSVYHNRAKEMDLKLLPVSAMSLVYPLAPEKLADLAYFFLAEGAPDAFNKAGAYTDYFQTRPGLARVLTAVKHWRKEFWRGLPPILSMQDDGETLEVLDSRSCASAFRNSFTGISRAILLACDQAPAADWLPGILAKDYNFTATPEEIETSIQDLRRRKLLIEIDGRVITLAISGDIPELPSRKDFPGGFVNDNWLTEN